MTCPGGDLEDRAIEASVSATPIPRAGRRAGPQFGATEGRFGAIGPKADHELVIRFDASCLLAKLPATWIDGLAGGAERNAIGKSTRMNQRFALVSKAVPGQC